MKKINRQFYLTIAGTVVIFGLVIWLYIVLFTRYPDSGLVYASMFLVILGLLYLLTYVQVRTENLTSLKNKYYIHENQGNPKNIKKAHKPGVFLKYLVDKGYQIFQRDDSFTLLYICEKDHIKKIFRGQLLQVVVIVDEKEQEFYLEDVDDAVERLKQKLYKEKKRPTSILISQYKQVSSITSRTKEQLEENILLKNRYGVYSVINIALDKLSKKAVFLYSESFTPSLYYRHQVDQILDSL